ncbi:MAG: hypothetical protein NTY53_05410 [Kiritimatiellaeota bacterium]|nr:hypothetical protein [Kiritimatiellota bacterium]
MRMKEEEDEGLPVADVRNVLLKAVEELTTNEVEAESALRQCADHFRNKHLLQHHVSAGGFTLTNEFTNQDMQIYGEITFEKETLAVISRGWDEPGFRLGQVLNISKDHMPELQQHSKEIMTLLATNGIAVTADSDADTHHLNLTFNIHDAGFNTQTLSDALVTISACIARIKATIPCE